MADPVVSIIVPSYNHAEFLEAALETVRAQTFTDWGMIVIDDCSPDHSLELARELAKGDARISVHQNERNLGTYGTEERARKVANGKYLAVLNSDDLWAPTKLEKQVQAMEAAADAPFCYTLGWKLNEHGEVHEGDDVHSNWPTEPVQELLPYLMSENRVLASSVLFRAANARFDPTLSFSGDWVALLRLARLGPALCVSERLTFWRQHSHNSFVRSPGQVHEEVRVRYAIEAAKPLWFTGRSPQREIRRGLASNARNLAALEILRGNRLAGVLAAFRSILLSPDIRGFRRLAVCMLIRDSKARLWPENQTVFEGPNPKHKPVDFT